jgi:ribonuclease HII
MKIAGVDEAGRGPLAGPVVCAAVILPDNDDLIGLGDSKKLSAGQRERLYAQIRSVALAYSIIRIEASTIDRINILQATLAGMAKAVHALKTAPELILIDGNRLPRDLPCQARAVISGDTIERSIMAASVLAKVRRDRIMLSMHRDFPEYGFDTHKGYPTTAHLRALAALGACPQHRRSYAPVKKAIAAHAP